MPLTYCKTDIAIYAYDVQITKDRSLRHSIKNWNIVDLEILILILKEHNYNPFTNPNPAVVPTLY